jgi:hypothetical protein
MSISNLFKSGNLDEIKAKSNALKPEPLKNLQPTGPTPIPVANLLTSKVELPQPPVVNQKVREVIVEKIVRDESAILQAKAEVEQIKTLNAKYLQVINQLNDELMTVKTNDGKNSIAAAEALKEKDALNAKIEELTKALLNVINQNKLLSRALGMRS